MKEISRRRGKTHVSIEYGLTKHTFLFSFNILNPTASIRTVLLDGNADITIKGEVIIPVKFLGILTWKHIKIPYNIHENMEVVPTY